MTTKETPPYGPYVGQSAKLRAIAEVQELERKHAGEMAGLREKEAARLAAEQQREEAAKQREAERRKHQEADLAGVRAEKRAEFFKIHPTAADSSFDTYWNRIRDDELSGLRERQVQQAMTELRASGRYGA